ncbi:MAG: hypothetical protein J6X61_04085 [Clostridia bacterium]|nr:hypothetical protein [Clostridia bacterium]
MRGKKRAALREAAGAFLLALILALMPVALVAGMVAADRNTRATAFPERRAVFSVRRQEDGSLSLAAFDWSARVTPEVMAWWDGGVTVVKTALPHAVKAGAAVIERIIDRFLPSADPAD